MFHLSRENENENVIIMQTDQPADFYSKEAIALYHLMALFLLVIPFLLKILFFGIAQLAQIFIIFS